MKLKIEPIAKPRFKHEKSKPNYNLYAALKRDLEKRDLTPDSYMRQAKMAAKLAGI
jgi:hypothetical protein